MLRFIKVFIITYVVLFILLVVLCEGNITETMIGTMFQASAANTVLWCILNPKFTK